MQRALSWAGAIPLAGLSLACLGFIAWAVIGLPALTGRITALGLVCAFCGVCLTLAGKAAWRGQERLAQAAIAATILLALISILAIIFDLADLSLFKHLANALPGGDPFAGSGSKVYRLPPGLSPDGQSTIIGPPEEARQIPIKLSLSERALVAIYTITGCLSLLCLLVPRNPDRLPAWGLFSTYLAGGLTILIAIPLLLSSLGVFSSLPGSPRVAGAILTTTLLFGSLAGLARLLPKNRDLSDPIPRQDIEPAVGMDIEEVPVPEQAAAAPAGWYPDPYGQAQLRYWDGQQWTAGAK